MVWNYVRPMAKSSPRLSVWRRVPSLKKLWPTGSAGTPTTRECEPCVQRTQGRLKPAPTVCSGPAEAGPYLEFAAQADVFGRCTDHDAEDAGFDDPAQVAVEHPQVVRSQRERHIA